MNLIPWRRKEDPVERSMPFQEWVELFNFNSNFYALNNVQQTLVGGKEEIGGDFAGLATQAYRSNPVVFACMETRRSHFSEARFMFRERRNGRPGNLFSTAEIDILNRPWPGGTTGDLLSRMIQDVDLAGNSYTTRLTDRLFRMRPDWVSILLGSRTRRADWEAGDPDTEVAAYLYQPGGKAGGRPVIPFLPEQVAHFAPIPDPLAYWRGMTWLTSLIREVQGDQMMSSHKNKFLEQGATVNMVVKIPADTVEKFNEWVEKIAGNHDGFANAYKTLYLGGGADATAVGSDMQQMDFKVVQGAGETRIAAAARTPPVLVGLSEGLQGSSLNTGNYQSARRMFADGVIRGYWRNASGSLANLVAVPGASNGNELWYDDRDVAFLKEDLKDIADVQQSQAAAVKSLIDSGFEPDAIIDAVTADDFSRLVGQHTGLTSVQLQPPATLSTGGTQMMNGKGTLTVPVAN